MINIKGHISNIFYADIFKYCSYRACREVAEWKVLFSRKNIIMIVNYESWQLGTASNKVCQPIV